MSAVYKYTMMKYLKSKSTWAILFISAVLIGFVVGAVVPFSVINPDKEDAWQNYAKVIVNVMSGVTIFLAIFTSVFVGFKTASLFRDEIDSGVFLIILSKPQGRKKIFIGKWLALQSAILAYALISVLFLAAGVGMLDNGDEIAGLEAAGMETLTDNLFAAAGFIFLICWVIGLIFSSIGLILSSFFSSIVTAGATIAIAIMIPVTSMIGSAMREQETGKLTSGDFFRNKERIDKTLEMAPHDGQLNYAYGVFQDSLEHIQEEPLSFETGSDNMFENFWFMDLSFHLSTMSELAYSAVVPDEIKNKVDISAIEIYSTSSEHIQVDKIQKTIDTYAEIASVKASATQLANAMIPDTTNILLRKVRQLYPSYVNFDTMTVAFPKSQYNNLITAYDNIHRRVPTGVSLVPNKVKVAVDRMEHESIAADSATMWVPYQSLEDIVEYLLEDRGYDHSDLVEDHTASAKMSSIKTEAEMRAKWYRYLKPIFSSLTTQASAWQGNDPEKIISVRNETKTFFQSMESLLEPTVHFTTGVGEARDLEVPKDQVAPLVVYEQKYQVPPLKLSSREARAAELVLAESEHGGIVETKNKDYTKDSTLLIAYALLALAMVPICYPILMRRDFR